MFRFIEVVEGDLEPPRGEQEMSREEASKYRAAAARLNFLAQDRSDLRYCAKECSRRMAVPVNHVWLALKKAARYLKGNPRMVYAFVWQDKQHSFDIFSDSDWAKCRATRQSASGGALMHGCHLLKSYSRTQATIALSSGEAELYAMTMACSEALGLVAMGRDFGESMKPVVHVDASAAIGIAQRKGLGTSGTLTRRRFGSKRPFGVKGSGFRKWLVKETQQI